MSDNLTPEQIAQLKAQADAAIKAAADRDRADIEAKAQERAKAEIEAKNAQDAQTKKLAELEALVAAQKQAAEAKEKELLAKLDQLAASKATIPTRDPFASNTQTTKVKNWQDLPEQTRTKIEDAYARKFFGSEYDKIFRN